MKSEIVQMLLTVFAEWYGAPHSGSRGASSHPTILLHRCISDSARGRQSPSSMASSVCLVPAAGPKGYVTQRTYKSDVHTLMHRTDPICTNLVQVLKSKVHFALAKSETCAVPGKFSAWPPTCLAGETP